MPYFAGPFAGPHQLTRRRANPHRALRNQGESNKLALVLIVCTGIPAYAQGKEWETLLGRIMALSGQGRYDDATVTGSREGASMAATSPPTEASCC